MAKMIRCNAGHVFDSKAHKQCPECVRLGLVQEDDGSEGIDAAKARRGRKGAGPLVTASGLAIPISWLIGGGAAALVAVSVGFIVLRPPAPGPEPAPQERSAIGNPSPETSIPKSGKPSHQSSLPGPENVVPITPAPTPTPQPSLIPTPQLVPPSPPPPQVTVFDPKKITIDKIGEMRSGWNAIAYNPKTKGLGESWGFSSQNQAIRRAVAECGGEEAGCKFAASFLRKCGAVAADPGGVWAGGTGDNIEGAVLDAFKDCVKNGGNNCELIRVNCSR